MAEEQPTFKVVDRRPFNPDGTPRELSAEEKEEAERAEKAAAGQEAAVKAASEEAAAAPPKRSASSPATETPHAKPKAAAPAAEPAPARTGGDPLDDPTSFLSLIMSLASNAAASLGMMPHPVTGETGVEKKTEGNLDEQEA